MSKCGGKFQPYVLCEQDSGLPARFVGEQDIFSWSAADEFHFETEGDGLCDEELDLRSRMSGRSVHRGRRVRLTSHRLVWHAEAAENSWLAVHLDHVEAAEPWGGMLRTKRCLLKLQSGRSVFIRCSVESQTDDVLVRIQSSVSSGSWRTGSYEVAAVGGLQRILDNRSSKQQATGEALDVAFADLESLRRHVTEATAAARQVMSSLARQGGSGYGAEGGASNPAAGSEVGKLLEDFGLLQADGTPISTAGGQSQADVVADVSKVCVAALEKKGGLGMLLAHDVFCLVNRARGTALVSPDEVMRALRSCASSGGPLRLRSLGSNGAFAVSLARTTDSELDSRLLKMAEAAPLSAFRLSTELQITAAEARYLLQDAEGRAIVVRDDAPECVYFYRNFFDDF
eukprot:gb/GFBE01036046.1/.p1 GENE.gb/GFBE01036046.1/~~gb/GFBE01036046.1/.p1  ORF type:complete len:400 (+),score=74.90 gb/GFBE01036046.1/:1-1200(+)